MTKAKRVLAFLQGSGLIVLSLLLFLAPEDGLGLVIVLIGIPLLARGVGAVFYYFRMARYMVGGKLVLYRGIIFLDLGILTLSISASQDIIILLGVAGANVFAGAIAMARSFEAKKIGSRRWIPRGVYGLVMLASAVAVNVTVLYQHQITIAVYVFAAGLVYTAMQRFSRAFRRSAIVYIP